MQVLADEIHRHVHATFFSLINQNKAPMNLHAAPDHADFNWMK